MYRQSAGIPAASTTANNDKWIGAVAFGQSIVCTSPPSLPLPLSLSHTSSLQRLQKGDSDTEGIPCSNSISQHANHELFHTLKSHTTHTEGIPYYAQTVLVYIPARDSFMYSVAIHTVISDMGSSTWTSMWVRCSNYSLQYLLLDKNNMTCITVKTPIL